MLNTRLEIAVFVRERAGELSYGINWEFAAFPYRADAEEFLRNLGPELESRGIYQATPDDLATVTFRFC